MSHSHSHAHAHPPRESGGYGLGVTMWLTAGMMVVEFVGGWLSGSLALISDAGHMLTDVLALGLSLLAVRFAATPATERKTYGFYRLEILAALANGVTLVLLSVYIFYEAWQRFRTPAPIHSGLMIAVAAAGLLVNAVGALILRPHRGHSLNVRGAFLHVVGDLLSSVAVVVAGGVIWLTGWTAVDPLLSVLIGGVILVGAYRLLKESLDILLEAAPAGVEQADVVKSLRSIPGVNEVHHVHFWTISSGIHALSAHLAVDDQLTSQSDAILRQAEEVLEHEFDIHHSTLQIEHAPCK